MLRRLGYCFSALVLLSTGSVAVAEAELSGRLKVEGSEPSVMLAAVRVFGFPAGSERGSAARSWETSPRGWWNLKGDAGEWDLLFSGPVHFSRPVVSTASVKNLEKNDSVQAAARFDYACFTDTSWDPKSAWGYWQPFIAKSTSVTHVGFKLATDGVDGRGPESQTMLLSVHECNDGAASTWPQIGPPMKVLKVDCGGPKSYHYSGAWHSGEVPLTVGKRYAVYLRPETKGNVLQTFWEPAREGEGCVRQAIGGELDEVEKRLWMTIAGDGDGLLLPVNKRIHREFGAFAGYTKSWTQTWKAQGKSLSGIMLYLATSGTQPRMTDQRIAVRVRRGGPDGPIISPKKLGAASANYTGDASWGVLGVVYPKGAVALTPGERYSVEFTTLETPESIGDFVNFKKQRNDRKPGFNPYLRHSADPYPDGAAYKMGTEFIDGDLDIQIVEYVDAE